jgi:hypothetical protein
MRPALDFSIFDNLRLEPDVVMITVLGGAHTSL